MMIIIIILADMMANVAIIRLMREIRQSIIDGRLDEYVKEFFRKQFPKGDYPEWAKDALLVAGIEL
jgi:queuine tRNA-ribosyltransferase